MTERILENGLVVVDKSHTTSTPALEIRIRELTQQLGNTENNLELYQEAIAELELALEDIGWQRLSGAGDREFSVAGLRKLRRFARLSYLKNPLIRHGVDVQSHYVWGQGCSISCGNSEVNDVIQKFLNDPKNTNVFTGHQARLAKDRELAVHGDLFLALFTNQNVGRVVVRSIFPDEVSDIICNPKDYQEPWFYKREWSELSFDEFTGGSTIKPMVVYYPDWRMVYDRDPETPHPMKIAGDIVMWDAPVYHIKVGGFGDQKFGCPEVYSALDWARAVKDDLEDYATVKRAHARFAWKQQAKGGKTGVSDSKKLLATTLNQDGGGSPETNPPPVTGATWIQSQGWDLSPIKTAGMAPNPDEGRRMWLMTSAGLGIPETILSGDADVGNYATAKSLDRPTELKMECRRTMWVDAITDILNYVVDMSIKCQNGALNGSGEEVIDEDTLQVTYVLDDDADRTITMRFPSILQRDALELVQAIVQGATLNGKPTAGTIPDKMISSMVMMALGEDEIDPIIRAMYPNDEITTIAGTGQAPPGVVNPVDLNKPPGSDGEVQDRGEMPDMGGGAGALPGMVPSGLSGPTDATSLMASLREKQKNKRTNLVYDDQDRVVSVEEVYVSSNGSHK